MRNVPRPKSNELLFGDVRGKTFSTKTLQLKSRQKLRIHQTLVFGKVRKLQNDITISKPPDHGLGSWQEHQKVKQIKEATKIANALKVPKASDHGSANNYFGF